MRDRDPNRKERIARQQEKVISKEEIEKRIDHMNKEKDDNAHVRKQDDYDRQRDRDRDHNDHHR